MIDKHCESYSGGTADSEAFVQRLDSGTLKPEERNALLAGNAFFSAFLMSQGMDHPAIQEMVKESFDTAVRCHIEFFKAQPHFPGFPPGFMEGTK